jgi:hypothetical protein
VTEARPLAVATVASRLAPSRNWTQPTGAPGELTSAVSVTARWSTEATRLVVVETRTVPDRAGELEVACDVPAGTKVAT